jgi:hypothetical protein
MTDWEGMSPNEFRAAGVLWAINSFVLWPIGLAIGVKIPSDDPNEPLVLMALSNPEVIIDGRVDLSREPSKCHPRERFIRYARYRIDQMTEMERSMAIRRLGLLFPGIGTDPKR